MWPHAGGPQLPWEQIVPQHSAEEAQDNPSDTQALPPQTPFVQTAPSVQHGREPSQGAPSSTQAPPHSPPTHGAPEQQGAVEHSAPSGMQAGGEFKQTPLEHTSPEQQGVAASHWLPNETHPPQ